MKTVAVFFGGRSAEHDVSIITALSSVIKPLELTGKYKVAPVYITKDGRWYMHDKLKDIKQYQGSGIEKLLASIKPVIVDFDGGFSLLQPTRFGQKRVKVDIAFPAMHGTFGEDGSLMGILDMANVPYVGCDLQSSVVAMDKILSKAVAKEAGLPTVQDVTFSASEYRENSSSMLDRIEQELSFPAFVKPPHLGSSVGVMKVVDRASLAEAIDTALHYDNKVLVEKAVANLREATLPIMGYGDTVIPALLEEPLFNTDEFFDFDTKYLRGGKGGKKGGGKVGAKQGAQGYSNVPANFPEKLYAEVQSIAVAGFKAAGCCGIARVDILIDETANRIYFNEINPLPGSLYAHNWAKAGYSNVALVEKLIEFALARFDERQRLITTFDTSFLKQF
ncbi:MAG TPA: D-alanine--D-alanine ligase family protein [Candidatus Saccharibacteria bacterium]|nr:D-alanine--D-alanine ligase family protein [Candidatus Saccharibacteria bacterium]